MTGGRPSGVPTGQPSATTPWLSSAHHARLSGKKNDRKGALQASALAMPPFVATPFDFQALWNSFKSYRRTIGILQASCIHP